MLTRATRLTLSLSPRHIPMLHQAMSTNTNQAQKGNNKLICKSRQFWTTQVSQFFILRRGPSWRSLKTIHHTLRSMTTQSPCNAYLTTQITLISHYTSCLTPGCLVFPALPSTWALACVPADSILFLHTAPTPSNILFLSRTG